MQDAATRCSERACIVRFASVPVAVTRWPTYFDRFKASAPSTIWIDAECFIRNPDFQLRARGASAPSVSFSQNESSPPCRQPLMVCTGVTAGVCAVSIGRLLDVRSGLVFRLAAAAGFTAAFVAEDGCADRGVIADPLVADRVAAIVESDCCTRLGRPIIVAAATMPTSAYVILREAGHPFIGGTASAGAFALRATAFFVGRD